jgi:hypothetical protein
MRKYLSIGLGALIAVAFAAPTFAQDNVSGLGSSEGAAGTIFIAGTANNNYYSKRQQCTDPSGTSSQISAAIADCCIAGDIWQLNLSKGTKSSLYRHVANVSQTGIGAASFAPDVYSPFATLLTSVKKVDLISTSGNSAPGGLPAGLTVQVFTNGGNANCATKQVVNGS